MASRFVEKNLSEALDHFQSYEIHQKKLSKIKEEIGHIKTTKKTNFKSEDIKSRIVNNKIKANEFLEHEKINSIKRSNQILLEKLLDISKGKWSSVNPQVKSQTAYQAPKSLNYVKKKQEAEKIDAENQAIMKRIVNQAPFVSKKKLDEEFEKNQRLKSQIQKGKQLPLEQILRRKRNLTDKHSSGMFPAVEGENRSQSKGASNQRSKVTSNSYRAYDRSQQDLNQESKDTLGDQYGTNDASSLVDAGHGRAASESHGKGFSSTMNVQSIIKESKPKAGDNTFLTENQSDSYGSEHEVNVVEVKKEASPPKVEKQIETGILPVKKPDPAPIERKKTDSVPLEKKLPEPIKSEKKLSNLNKSDKILSNSSRKGSKPSDLNKSEKKLPDTSMTKKKSENLKPKLAPVKKVNEPQKEKKIEAGKAKDQMKKDADLKSYNSDIEVEEIEKEGSVISDEYTEVEDSPKKMAQKSPVVKKKSPSPKHSDDDKDREEEYSNEFVDEEVYEDDFE